MTPADEQAREIAGREVIDLPRPEQPKWHFPYHEADRVIIENRLIPKLTAMAEGDEVAIILDGRLSISVPASLGQQVAWLVANALAIGAGYSHLGAETKDQPFAPEVAEFGSLSPPDGAA